RELRRTGSSLTGEWRKSLPSANRMHVIRVPISAPTYGSVNGRSMTQRLGARFRGACSMAKKYNHLGVTRPVRKCCPLCPGKRTYLPILELLPPPTLRERRHRGPARRRACIEQVRALL